MRSARQASRSEAEFNTRKSPGRRTKVFSWRKKTVSSPTVMARGPRPIVTPRMGGAEAAPRVAQASGEAYGHFSSDSFPAASFVANARQAGEPHSPHFAFGRS